MQKRTLFPTRFCGNGSGPSGRNADPPRYFTDGATILRHPKPGYGPPGVRELGRCNYLPSDCARYNRAWFEEHRSSSCRRHREVTFCAS